MNLKSRVCALGLSAALALSATGCNQDTTWAAKSGEDTMTAGVYILALVDGYYNTQTLYQEKFPDAPEAKNEAETFKNVLKADFDGKKGSALSLERAQDAVRRYFATEKLFRERGLTMTEADQAVVTQNIEMIWPYNGTFYQQNGISKDSATTSTRNYVMANALMSQQYGQGGDKAISDADYEKYFIETRARVRYMPFSLVDATTGAAMTAEQVAEVEKKANTYLERVKKGEDFTKLILEQQREASGEELDATPGVYDMLLTKDSTSMPQKMIDEMFAAPVNEARLMVEENNAIFVGMRVDTLFSREDFESSKNAMLKEMKQEEFDAWLLEQGNAMEITMNPAALKRYSPDKLNFKEPDKAVG